LAILRPAARIGGRRAARTTERHRDVVEEGPPPLPSRRPRHGRVVALLEAVEPRTLLTTYYVSPSGSDSDAGTSSGTPFKSIAKINSLNLNPGDNVLFEGGQTFNPPSPSATNQVSDGGFESGNFNAWGEDFGGTSINTANVHYRRTRDESLRQRRRRARAGTHRQAPAGEVVLR
jgi:hypothetical protein